jgi:hypothetical protein
MRRASRSDMTLWMEMAVQGMKRLAPKLRQPLLASIRLMMEEQQ